MSLIKKQKNEPCERPPMFSKYIMSIEAPDGMIESTVCNIQTDNQTENWSGDKLASYSFIEQSMKSMTGKILTIVDASIPSGTQNKCIKDLIRKEFIQEFQSIQDMMFDKQRIDRCLADERSMIVSAQGILGA